MITKIKIAYFTLFFFIAILAIILGQCFSGEQLPSIQIISTSFSSSSSGITGTTTTTTTTIVHIGPTVNILLPDPTCHTDKALNITGTTISGTGEGIVVSVWVNAISGTNIYSGTATGTSAWAIQFTNIPDGLYSITATAIDTNNEYGSAQLANIRYDSTAPIGSFVYPLEGSVVGKFIHVTGTVDDSNGSGISSITLLFDGSTYLAGTNSTWDVYVSTLTSGSQQISGTIIDNCGNIGLINAISITIDTSIPVVYIASPPYCLASNLLAKVEGTAIDPDGTVVSMGILLDGTIAISPIFTPAASGEMVTWTFDLNGTIPSGQHLLVATATDNENKTGLTNYIFLIDLTNPTIGFDSVPVSGCYNIGEYLPLITGTAYDMVASISNIDYVMLYLSSSSYQASQNVGNTPNWSYSFPTNSMAQGNYNIYAVVTDTCGNTAIANGPMSIILNSPPSVSIGYPLNGCISNNNITFSGNAIDTFNLDYVNYSITGPSNFSGSASMISGSSWQFPNTLSPDGTYTFSIQAYDLCGSFSSIATSSAVIDTAPPTIEITTPNLTVFTTGAFSLAGTANDNISLTSVSIAIDGVSDAANLAGNNWTYNNNTTDGMHLITATAYDSCGNVTAATSIQIEVNLGNPSVTISHPIEGNCYNTLPISIYGNATDNVSVSSVHVSVDGGAFSGVTGFSGPGSTISWTSSAGSLISGVHTVVTQVSDNLNHTSLSSIITFNVDIDAPHIGITTTSGYTFPSNNVTINGTASDNINISYVYVNIGGLSSGTASGTTLWTYNEPNLGDGTHIVTATAYDTCGNTVSGTISVTVNTGNPTCNILNPIDGNCYNTVPINIYGTGNDSNQIKSVQLSIDGGSYNNVTGFSGTAVNITWTNSSGALSNGTHTVVARVYDTINNPGLSSVVSFNVDTQIPTLGLTTANNTTFTSSSVTINGTATDNLSLNYILVKVGSTIGTVTGSPWTFNTSVTPDGTYQVTATAYDNCGNVAGLTPISIYVSSVPPTVTILNTTDCFNSTTVSIYGTAYDLNTIRTVQYKLDNGATTAVTGFSGITQNVTWTSSLTGLSQGIHTIVAFGTDIAGMTGTSNIYQFRVDTSLPTGNFISPTSCMGTTAFNMTGTAADTGSGVGLVEISINGSTTWQIAGTSSPWTLPVTGMGAGDHSARLRVTDICGNVMSPITVTFGVFLGTSKLTVLAPTGTVNTCDVMIAGTFDIPCNCDAGTIQYSVDAGTWTPVSSIGNGTYTQSTQNLQPFTHTMQVRITNDCSGSSFSVTGSTSVTTGGGFAIELYWYSTSGGSGTCSTTCASADQDSHVYFMDSSSSSQQHVYYGNLTYTTTNGGIVKLDHDDLGPDEPNNPNMERLDISCGALAAAASNSATTGCGNDFLYMVRNWTDHLSSPARNLRNIGAGCMWVKVYYNGSLTNTFHIEDATDANGDYWNIFRIDPSSRTVTVLSGSAGYISSSLDTDCTP